MSDSRVAATILNVNDREANRYAITRMLAAAGFRVIEAADGTEALQKALTHAPELAVLDVNLPDMSGFEVARRLKGDPATRHILILHVSAISVYARHRAEGLEHGADSYLTEPFEREELIATVNALLRMGRAEAAARGAATEWQSTFDALSEGIALVDATGRIRQHNGALAELLGPNVRVNALLPAVVGESAAQVLSDAIAHTARAGERRRLELAHEGRTFRIALDAVHHGARAGSGSVIAAIEEITQIKRAESALRLLSEAGQTLMSTLDYEETVRRVAESAVPALGDLCCIDLREEDGSLRRVVAPGGDRNRDVCEALEQALPDPKQPTLLIERAIYGGKPELIATFGDGDLNRLSADPARRELYRALGIRSLMTVPLTLRERTLGALTFVSTSSSRRFAEEELALAGELSRRAVLALENARLHRESRQALNMRDEFFSIASHELKNPLSALLLQLKLLQRELRRSTERRMSYDTMVNKVDAAERNASRLGQLVQELLDTTRIRAGRLELRIESFDLGLLARDVVRFLESEAQAARTTITLDTEANVVGRWDRSRLEQVVMNLVGNAVKYGGGRPVHVSVKRSATGAELSVRDGGAGIAPADRERIFEAFERGRSLSGGSGTTGLGLGLYISRKIVESHGGRIALESEPGCGSTFSVSLPMEVAAEAPLTSAATAG